MCFIHIMDILKTSHRCNPDSWPATVELAWTPPCQKGNPCQNPTSSHPTACRSVGLSLDHPLSSIANLTPVGPKPLSAASVDRTGCLQPAAVPSGDGRVVSAVYCLPPPSRPHAVVRARGRSYVQAVYMGIHLSGEVNMCCSALSGVTAVVDVTIMSANQKMARCFSRPFPLSLTCKRLPRRVYQIISQSE